MNPLLGVSATRLAQMIRGREVTSLEVVEAHIRRAEESRPLNAIVCDRFEEARAEARRADERVAGAAANPDALGPFHGVPCTIKEAFGLEGMPNTSGLVSRKGLAVTADATAVVRLRAAGAIPIGVTNVSELCMWMESHNLVYGRTRNPYDPSRIVGGSSGGEGAIIGFGASPFGLGSDIGGSIRLPAFFNGVFGHKPTGGLVPATGQYPIASGIALRMLATGALARRAEDLMPLLRVLAGPDDQDAACAPAALGDPGSVRMDSVRVLDVRGNGAFRVSDDLLAAQARCAAALSRRGARVERRRFEAFRRSLEIWSAMMSSSGGPSFASLMGGGPEVAAGWELLRWAVGRSPHTLPAIGLALVERLTKRMHRTTARYLELGQALRREVVDALGQDGVLLFPPYPTSAPRHGAPLLPPLQWVFTAIFNALELPVTQVPLGLDRRGLPLGVQVAAAHGNDHLTIAVAMELERAFGGWTPPPRPRSRT